MANVLKYTGVALAAGVAGAVLGLLFAPAPGAVTRRRLGYRFAEQREALLARSRAVRESIKGSRRRLAGVVNG